MSKLINSTRIFIPNRQLHSPTRVTKINRFKSAAACAKITLQFETRAFDRTHENERQNIQIVYSIYNNINLIYHLNATKTREKGLTSNIETHNPIYSLTAKNKWQRRLLLKQTFIAHEQ